MRVGAIVSSICLMLGSAPLSAQESTPPTAGSSFTGIATQMRLGEDVTLRQLLFRTGRIEPAQARFEWGAGILESGGAGGLMWEGGPSFALGPREATVLLRGGLSALLTGAIDESGVGIGVYGGTSILLGDVRQVSLRIELARHAYRWYRETRGAWVVGVGFTWRQAAPKDTGH